MSEHLSEASLRFDGEVVIVTGAGSGLGRSHALEFARRGARVVVNDFGTSTRGVKTEDSPANEVVAEILAGGGEAIANYDSAATPEGADGIIAAALDQWGRLDVLVCNAGFQRDIPVDEMSTEDFDAVLDVHLRGPFFLAQRAFRAMKTAGGGRILITTSTSGLFGCSTQANYAAAKAGVLGLVQTLALEGREFGIRANALSPGARTRGSLTDPTALRFRGRTAPKYPELAELMTTERVTALAVALAHESCELSGTTALGWGGYYGRAEWRIVDDLFETEEVSPEEILGAWSVPEADLDDQTHRVRSDGFDVVMEVLERSWESRLGAAQ